MLWPVTVPSSQSLIFIFVSWRFLFLLGVKRSLTLRPHTSVRPSVSPFVLSVIECRQIKRLSNFHELIPKLSSKLNFRENLLSYFTSGGKWLFYPHCPYFLTDSCEIWYTRTLHNNVKQLPVSWKPASERHTLRSRWNPLQPSFYNFHSPKNSAQVMSTDIC
jgi:hypothetical protein